MIQSIVFCGLSERQCALALFGFNGVAFHERAEALE
jgi:hypothetical protein